jgi:hypothetical protein
MRTNTSILDHAFIVLLLTGGSACAPAPGTEPPAAPSVAAERGEVCPAKLPPPPAWALQSPPVLPDGLVAQAAVHQLRFQAVQVSDDDGGRQAPLTIETVRDWLQYANRIFASTNIQFVFDASPGTQDFVTLRSTAINDLSPHNDNMPWQSIRAANEYAARFPGKVVGFFRWGDGSAGTGNGYGDSANNFILMPGSVPGNSICGTSPNIGLFAHELGHFLGLPHTFPAAYDDIGRAESAFLQGGSQRSVFDGDRITDTNEDPFIWSNGCDTSQTTVTLWTQNSQRVDFVLPRTNIMSYYVKAANTEVFSPGQANVQANNVRAGPRLQEGARFQLVANHSNKCLDIHGGTGVTGNGVAAVQWDCLGKAQTNQLFTLVPMGDDLVQIRAAHSGKCVDVLGASGNDGAQVVQWDCLGDNQRNQLWRLVRVDGAIVGVQPAHVVGKCLDVPGFSQSNGASVVQRTCGNTTNQQWRLRPLEDDIMLLANHSSQCLDVADAAFNDGADVVHYQCWGANDGQQQWRFAETSPGIYRITAKHSGKCLDVDGGLTNSGANVWQWRCIDGARNQRWRLRHLRADRFQLLADHSGHCLAVNNGDRHNGANVVQSTCRDSSLHHQWRLGTRRLR